MKYFPAIKKNEIMPSVATWMDLESFILSEVRQRNIIWHPLYVRSNKKWYKWTYLQNRTRLTDLENRLMVIIRGKGYLGNLGWSCIHCYISNGVPTRTNCIVHGTLLNITWMGGELGENGYLYMHARAPHCSHETITTLLISSTSIQNQKFKRKKKSQL